MITDSQTNFLYLADSLQKKYPNFFDRFEKVLNDCNIEPKLLPGTKDVWAVDYMPIQIKKDEFVQFVYNPNYLRNSIKWRKTISDVDAICAQIDISPKKSNIVLDGGNVVRTTDKVIMCDKIFSENPTIQENNLIKELEQLFQVDKLIFIPTDSEDEFGHADGMARFYNNDTVLINDYSKEKPEFQRRFKLALNNAGLHYIEIPYNPYGEKRRIIAKGIFMNYLQMEQAIIIPTFDITEDDIAFKQFEQLFPDKKLATIDSNEIAFDGGILNCITWNILK